MAVSRGMTTELARVFAGTAAPIYVLDDDRRIVYCNAVCAEWLKLPADDIFGKTCVYSSSDAAIADPILARLAGLCPPPESFAGVRSVALVSCAGSDGQLRRRRAEFVPLTDHADATAAVLAIAGSADLPSDPAEQSIQPTDESMLLHVQLQRLHHELRGQRQMDRLLGVSPAMVRVRAQVQLAAAGMASVVVIGPPGSGRQYVAKAVHYGRRDADAGSLVPLSCALLGTDLLRSTLAALLSRGGSDRKSSGTLLLSDVHELPPEVQTELIGHLKDTGAALRIVSTSIAPLDELAESGGFRADLACALSTIAIHLPPLSVRREDIPLLAQAFVEESNALGDKQLRGFSPEAIDQLAAYSWPGNIDELAAAVREAQANAEAVQIVPSNLPQQVHLAAAASRLSRRAAQPIQLEGFLGEIERELILRALRLAKGNKTKAARLLGLTRPRLYRRMVQLGLEQEKEVAKPAATADNDEIEMFEEE